MAHDHRSERPTRRGRIDDSGGDTEGGQKLYYHLTLLAENDVGYRNLIQLSSRAFLEGYYYKPRLDWELLAEHHEGLIATTGCLGGHVLQSLLQGDDAGRGRRPAACRTSSGATTCSSSCRTTACRPSGRPTRSCSSWPASCRRRSSPPTTRTTPTVRTTSPTTPCCACRPGPCSPTRSASSSRAHEHYLKTADEMRLLFRDLPEACDNTLWVAERADRRHRVRRAAAARLPAARRVHRRRRVPRPPDVGGRPRALGRPTRPRRVKQRVQFELDVISTMGFSSYFLIVWDLIRHARSRGIRVGPGRGSAAGCAVAYCLRITDLDPIHYDLLFERFLNPSRISMPDIDMDFDSRYRDEMIRYAAERYGRDHVAQIITFGTIKARNAVRDAARVLGFPYGTGDRIAKAMPPLVMGRDTPLKYCFEQDPEVRRRLQGGRRAAGDVRHRPGRQEGRRRRQGSRGPEALRRHPRRGGRDHEGTADRVPAGATQAGERPGPGAGARSSRSTRCTASSRSAC